MGEVREVREAGRVAVEEATAARLRAEEGRRREVEVSVAGERASRNAEAERAAGASAALIAALQKELRECAARGEAGVRAESTRAARAESRLEDAEEGRRKALEEAGGVRGDLARAYMEVEGLKRGLAVEREAWRVRVSEVEGMVGRERGRVEVCEGEIVALRGALAAREHALEVCNVEVGGLRASLEECRREGGRERVRREAEVEALQARVGQAESERAGREKEVANLGEALAEAQAGVAQAIAGLEASGRALGEERAGRVRAVAVVEELKATLAAVRMECVGESERARRVVEACEGREREAGAAIERALEGEKGAREAAAGSLARVKELEVALAGAGAAGAAQGQALAEALAAKSASDRERGTALIRLGEAEERARVAQGECQGALKEMEEMRKARRAMEGELGEREGEAVALSRQLDQSRENEKSGAHAIASLTLEVNTLRAALDACRAKVESMEGELVGERAARGNAHREAGSATSRANAAEGRVEELTCALALSKGAEAKAVAAASASAREAEVSWLATPPYLLTAYFLPLFLFFPPLISPFPPLPLCFHPFHPFFPLERQARCCRVPAGEQPCGRGAGQCDGRAGAAAQCRGSHPEHRVPVQCHHLEAGEGAWGGGEPRGCFGGGDHGFKGPMLLPGGCCGCSRGGEAGS